MNILLCLPLTKDPPDTYLLCLASGVPAQMPIRLCYYPRYSGPFRESQTCYEYIYEGSMDLEPLVIFMARGKLDYKYIPNSRTMRE